MSRTSVTGKLSAPVAALSHELQAAFRAQLVALPGEIDVLGLRAVAVLTSLVKQPNEYVRKETILDAAWSGVVVEEGNLPVQILAIHRALATGREGAHHS